MSRKRVFTHVVAEDTDFVIEQYLPGKFEMGIVVDGNDFGPDSVWFLDELTPEGIINFGKMIADYGKVLESNESA